MYGGADWRGHCVSGGGWKFNPASGATAHGNPRGGLRTTTFPGLDFSQWLAPVGAVIGLQPANASSDVSASFVPAGGSSATAWLDADGDNHDRDHDNYRDRDRDRDHDRDRDPDHDHDRDHGRPHSPSPTPEPSTLLSFGTAIIIGGGVFFLGRLR